MREFSGILTGREGSTVTAVSYTHLDVYKRQVLEDPITRTLETNYMPYAMSVIVSRALPEIDGFKPAHRKLLYTCLLYTSRCV